MAGGSWSIQPMPGTSGRTFLALGSRALVVRVGARPDVARRLSALEVSPPVVAEGRIGSTPFVLQEPIVAPHGIDPAWMRANRAAVAQLLGRYLGDSELIGLSAPLDLGPHVERLAGELARRDRTRAHLADLLVRSLPAEAAVATAASHGDPNIANFLFGERLWLVDWDDLARADPVRDIGQVAWWYLDEETWPDFIAACGQPPAAVERVHWWAAAESLDVALRLTDRDAEAAEAFLGDFEAAVTGRSNPRRG